MIAYAGQDNTDYTPWVQLKMVTSAAPVGPLKPVLDQLRELGVDAHDVDAVIFRFVLPTL